MLNQFASRYSNFLLYHFLLPFIAFAVLIAVLELTTFDVWLVSHFYNADFNTWPYRDHWLTQNVIHKGGRFLVYGLGGILLGAWLWSWRVPSILSKYRRNLSYLIAASVTGPLIVTVLKSRTHIYCPWNLTLFGGDKPYIRLFDPVTPALTVGHCFPSGHSVLGFTFVGMYFYLLSVNPKYKYVGLWIGLIWGLIFGIDQQVRGAHFFSHDIYSLAICWFSAAFLYLIFFRQQLSRRQAG